MTHNPYTPPAADVGDAPEIDPGQRPVAVVIAVALVAVYAIFAIFSFLRVWYLLESAIDTNLILLGLQVAKGLLLFLVCLYLWRGRNWARILLLALTAFSLLSVMIQFAVINDLPAGVRTMVDPMGVVITLLPLLVYVLATYLVFFPGRAWFARRR